MQPRHKLSGNGPGRRRRLVVAAVALALSAPAYAQPVRKLVLAPPSGTLNAEFVGITSIRELADGRVIVTDGRDQKLYLADYAKKSAAQLGTKGKGPKEWTGVGFVYAIGGDSTIMSDFNNGRWLLMSGGEIVGTVPPDNPVIRSGGVFMRGADRLGHVVPIISRPSHQGDDVTTEKDSTPLVLRHRGSGKADTITKLRDRPSVFHRTEKAAWSDVEPTARGEEFALGADGSVAVVRLNPIRVDWRSPDGVWTRGAPLPVKDETPTASERKAMELRYAALNSDNKKSKLPLKPLDVPKILPATSGEQPRITNDGRAIVRRTTPTGSPLRFLVVNRNGGLDGEITIGPKERIVGFGAKSVYIASKDEDDIETLRRHNWP